MLMRAPNDVLHVPAVRLKRRVDRARPSNVHPRLNAALSRSHHLNLDPVVTNAKKLMLVEQRLFIEPNSVHRTPYSIAGRLRVYRIRFGGSVNAPFVESKCVPFHVPDRLRHGTGHPSGDAGNVEIRPVGEVVGRWICQLFVLRLVLGPDADLIFIFESIDNHVMVLLKLMPSLRLQLLLGQRFNGVVGSDFQAVADRTSIRKKEITFGITRLSQSAVQNLPVVRAADELKDDLQGLTVIGEGNGKAGPNIVHSVF